MTVPLMSKRKADAISNGVFLIGLGLLFYTQSWWPGILLVIWATLATRQYLRGRIYDMIISTIILVGLFIVSIFHFNWDVIMPILFVLGGIYIIFREYFVDKERIGEEKTVEMKKEIEDAEEQ